MLARQQQGSGRNSIGPQGTQGHFWAGRKSFHYESSQRVFHAVAQRLTDPSESSAQDNNLWMEQVPYVRKAKSQIFRQFGQESPGIGIAFGQRRKQQPCLASDLVLS